MMEKTLEEKYLELEKRVAVLEIQIQAPSIDIKMFVNNRAQDVRELAEELESYRSKATHKTE